MNEEQTYPTKPNTQDTQDIQQPCETLAQCSDVVEFRSAIRPRKAGSRCVVVPRRRLRAGVETEALVESAV